MKMIDLSNIFNDKQKILRSLYINILFKKRELDEFLAWKDGLEISQVKIHISFIPRLLVIISSMLNEIALIFLK